MTAATLSSTPRRLAIRTSRGELQDAGFLVVLTVIGLIGFRSTFSGNSYLIVGVVGLALGLLIGHLSNVLRQPVIAIAAVTILIFFLLGGAVALRGETALGILPTSGALHRLASVSIDGWKDLVTTLPPVDGTGELLVLPYLLGLACGATGMTLARRLRHPLAPVAAPLALLVTVILLGAAHPAAQWAQGLGFGIVALPWIALRGQRARPLVGSGAGRGARMATAAGLLLVTTPLAALVGPHLPGIDSSHRVVVRSYVQPPFDMSAYASPLVGFRKYTKDANLLWNQKLLSVSGLSAGESLRLAVLDDYNGMVWGARSGGALSDSGQLQDVFQRVGSRIPAEPSGKPTTISVTVAPAYASINDASAWLPEVQGTRSITFTGPHAAENSGNLRYNLATSAAVVIDRLQAGDSYTLQATIPTTTSKQLRPYGQPSIASSEMTFATNRATQWAGQRDDVWSQVQAIAQHLRSAGYYSDGGKGEEQYLPGHSVFRLSSFLDSPQIVGDDEQYAAAFALLGNSLGMPTRVVLGATPVNGAVYGKDVHAWVEVHLGDGTWLPIPQSSFMPPQSKRPTKQPPQHVSDSASSIVPPPNATRPPSSIDTAAAADSNSLRSPSRHKKTSAVAHLPHLLVTLVRWLAPPLLVIALLCAAIAGAKARRRSRRRRTGEPPTRIARGWTEIVDLARDLGNVVPTRATRREQASAIVGHDVAALAYQADATIFGPEPPSAQDAQAYWSSVDVARRSMTRSLGRWQRIRVALSVRSLAPTIPRTVRTVRRPLLSTPAPRMQP
jgi:hypothetical protein